MRIFLILFLIIIVSCEQLIETKTKPAVPSDYAPKSAIELDADFYAKEGFDFSLTADNVFAADVSVGYTFTPFNLPAWASFNAGTGEITGVPNASGVTSDILIIATNGTPVNSSVFSIGVNGDPLRAEAWHLENTGQKTYAQYAGTAGNDINVFPVFKDGITGDGIKIAISDSGVEVNHNDLYENELIGQHRNYTLSPPYIGTPVATGAHGTAVAGLVSAKGWNNRGSIGVAPNSKFAGFQFLSSPQSPSILIHQASGDFNIFNYSYGDEIYSDAISDPDYLDHLRYQSVINKKIFVKSAGNYFIAYDDYSNPSYCVSHNANSPLENESPFLIVTGAVSANGVKATYASAGSNIWVSAPGGEYGQEYPAILTTDLPTCFKGYSKQGSYQYNDFEYGHSLNSQCHYTSTMNGTSSAAPIVSGIAALMLEAKSGLTQRDIKDILAKTAVKIDPNHNLIDIALSNNPFELDHPSTNLMGCPSLDLAGHNYALGWVTNAAGFAFNNHYGFGLVDAEAAVNMAKTYTPMDGLIEINPNYTNSDFSRSPGLSIPNNSSVGVSDNLTVTEEFTVEVVQIKISASHGNSGELGVELTSPSGTKSILLNINHSFLIDHDKNLTTILTSNAFYGETSKGTWTLKVIDANNTDNANGTLNSWKMNLLGH